MGSPSPRAADALALPKIQEGISVAGLYTFQSPQAQAHSPYISTDQSLSSRVFRCTAGITPLVRLFNDSIVNGSSNVVTSYRLD